MQNISLYPTNELVSYTVKTKQEIVQWQWFLQAWLFDIRNFRLPLIDKTWIQSMNWGRLIYKFLWGTTSTFFGNVCVTNTNCEQQIPPKAGFCFLAGEPAGQKKLYHFIYLIT